MNESVLSAALESSGFVANFLATLLYSAFNCIANLGPGVLDYLDGGYGGLEADRDRLGLFDDPLLRGDPSGVGELVYIQGAAGRVEGGLYLAGTSFPPAASLNYG